MKKYFKDEYNEYYNAYSDTSELENSINILTSSIDGIKTELSGIVSLFSELSLSGEYSDEIYESLTSIDEMVQSMCDTLDSGLPETSAAMSELGENLTELKTKDEDYQDKQEDLADYGGKPKQYTTDSAGKTITNPEYTSYNILTNEISELETELDGIVTIVENDIQTIKSFSDSIVEIRMQIASFNYASAFSQDEFDNFANLSLEEKEAFIQKLIENMTGKYLEYKEAYEQYSRFWENMSDEEFEAFFDVVSALGIVDDNFFLTFMDGSDPINCGLSMLDLLDVFDEYNLIDTLDNYLNKGQSWEDSGMLDLQKAFLPETELNNSGNYYDEYGEDVFWNEMDKYSRGIYTRDNKSELNQHFKSSIDIFREDCEGFRVNFTKAGNAVVAIQGLKETKKHLAFDSYYTSDEYANFQSQWGNDPTFTSSDTYKNLLKMAPEGHENFYQWMSADEKRMLEFLYNTDQDRAKAYIDSLSLSFNRREGYAKAKAFYDNVHEGSNEWLDAIRDHGSYFFEGFDLGVDNYVGGLVNLISPEAEYNVNDYFNMSTLSMLSSSGDPYDKGLLISYNLGEAGGEMLIPTVVSLFNPTAAAALSVGSSMGSGMKAQNIQANLNGETLTWGELVRDNAMSTIATRGYEALTKALPTKWGLDAFTDGMFTADKFNSVLSPDDEAVVAANYFTASNGGEDLNGYGMGGDKFVPGDGDTFEGLDKRLYDGGKGALEKKISGGLDSLIGKGLKAVKAPDRAADITKAAMKPLTSAFGKTTMQTGENTFADIHRRNVANGTGITLTEVDGTEVNFAGKSSVLGLVETGQDAIGKMTAPFIPKAAAEESNLLGPTASQKLESVSNSLVTSGKDIERQNFESSINSLQPGEVMKIYGTDGNEYYIANDGVDGNSTLSVFDTSGNIAYTGLNSSQIVEDYSASPIVQTDSSTENYNVGSDFVNNFGTNLIGSGKNVGKKGTVNASAIKSVVEKATTSGH